MSWLNTIPYLVGLAAFLFLPGVVILRASGVRGLGVAAFALPVTASVMGVFAVLLPFVGAAWNPVSFLICAAITAVLALLTRFVIALINTDISRPHSFETVDSPVVDRLRRFRWGVDAPVSLIYLAAVALPAFAIFYRYAHGFGNVERISQTFDNIYHLNAIRRIMDTGSGSSLTLGNLTAESAGFYPAAWHDMVAQTALLLHVSIPAAVNMTNIVIACLVWPLSLLFLITRITGPRLLPIVLTAALAPAFPAFPYLMVEFGVLYPNHLAIAILPAVIGAVLQILGMTQADTPTFWPGLVALVGSLPGMLLAHPSTLMALIAFVMPVMVTKLWWMYIDRRRSPADRRRFWAFLGLFVAYAVIGLICWVVLRPAASSSTWPPFQSPAQATGEVLAGTPMGLPGGTLMFILTTTGVLFLVLTRRQRWVVGMFLMGAWLYVTSTSYPFGDVRTFFTGIWYNDSNRLAALLPVVSAPVVVLGGEFLIRWVTKRVMQSETYARLAATKAPWLNQRLIVSAVLAMLLVGAGALQVQSGAMTAEQAKLNGRYYSGKESLLLSPDERALLDRLPEHVAEGDVVVGSPWTGASLVYAISDRQTLRPHIYGAVSPDAQYALEHWEEAPYNTAACSAVKNTRAFYALDFGPLEVHHGWHPIPGLSYLEGAAGVELVDQQGAAKLYKMTGCK
ncbi:DUF6541 family protein [Falsarthrobacter nasiphocae]|uniref:Uncharacterized protein n=1 Tax=Falsarthrobacter nasiphocae TaxID=189863 RepID=A0AAE3YCJ6_9MICC|nr:DUF6541 family protein [Falsarthrobacter nasiphocae]MDR6891408.1 hypothetical protein [Falsarthrobacter nasiphocae]